MSDIISDGSRTHGYVAFIDLLGFSELVKRIDFGESFDQYTEIIETNLESKDINLQYIIFSDSIIINTGDIVVEQLNFLIQSISQLSYQLLIEMNLPLCGSISVGEFSRKKDNKGNVMIAGPPIVDAVHYEKQQDWIGCMLTPKVIKQNPELRTTTLISPEVSPEEIYSYFKYSKYTQRYEKIPFRDSTFDGYALLPQSKKEDNVGELLECLNFYDEKLDELKLYSPNFLIQRKYSNTQKFIRTIIERWEASTVKRHSWNVFEERARRVL